MATDESSQSSPVWERCWKMTSSVDIVLRGSSTVPGISGRGVAVRDSSSLLLGTQAPDCLGSSTCSAFTVTWWLHLHSDNIDVEANIIFSTKGDSNTGLEIRYDGIKEQLLVTDNSSDHDCQFEMPVTANKWVHIAYIQGVCGLCIDGACQTFQDNMLQNSAVSSLRFGNSRCHTAIFMYVKFQ